MQLQLYALPVSGRFQGDLSSQPDERSPGMLHCLLQANGLPHGQHLEIQVNDTLKRWQQGSNHVFTWELQANGEEISLHLRNETHDLASWRGIWKGQAIYHLGALPIRVFFNGVEQPLLDASTVIPLVDPAQEPFPSNGREAVRALPPEYAEIDRHAATFPLVEPVGESLLQETETGEGDIPPDADASDEEEIQALERAIAQEERRRTESAYPREDEEMHDWDEEGEEIEEGEEQQDGEEEEEEQRDDSRVFAPAPLVLAEEQARGAVTHEEGSEARDEEVPLTAPSVESMPLSPLPHVEAPTPVADTQDETTPGKVATFHADPAGASPTCEQLKALLLLMPKKTVIIDLRELSRTRHKEESHPLSKAHLRAHFGGRYWDRSHFIKTTYRPLPETQRVMGRYWERVVSDVDHPEGLVFLEKYLRAGYSMIFLDATHRSEESTRRAVVMALRERIPQFEEVTLPL